MKPLKILVVDDSKTNRKLLQGMLSGEGYDVQEAQDGIQALAVLEAAVEPLVALLDWQMPGMEGIEVCRRARQGKNTHLLFLILQTACDSKKEIVAGLQAGANDYITKPFDGAELLARVKIGVQMLELQQTLARRVQELEHALDQVQKLKGLLPICMYCKKIRGDKDYWQQVEEFIAVHSDATFSHGICPECYETQVKPELAKRGITNLDIS